MLKQSPTPSGPSLSVPSIIVQPLMIPIHTPAQRGLGELGRGVWKTKRRTWIEEEREPERKIVVGKEKEATGIKRDEKQ